MACASVFCVVSHIVFFYNKNWGNKTRSGQGRENFVYVRRSNLTGEAQAPAMQDQSPTALLGLPPLECDKIWSFSNGDRMKSYLQESSIEERASSSSCMDYLRSVGSVALLNGGRPTREEKEYPLAFSINVHHQVKAKHFVGDFVSSY